MAEFERKLTGGRPVRKSPAIKISQTLARLLGRLRLDSCLDLRFHGIEVEARALLHRRELGRGPGELFHFLPGKHRDSFPGAGTPRQPIHARPRQTTSSTQTLTTKR